MFDAYLHPWTKAARVLGADGFRTGDIGWVDVDGDIHLLGRRHNRIDVAGMKFFAEEVESVLGLQPSVAESRVFGISHDALGEIPVAEVALRAGAPRPTADDLRAFCRERLEGVKVPREFRFVESLATTPTGKVRRWIEE
jgi:long-chain acyl-CoA synthetase